MKTQLATRPGRREHPPQPERLLEEPSVRRVGLLDRAALHLGVALIKWGRRSIRPHSQPQLTLEVLEARREMERVRAQQAAMISRFR